MKTQSKFLASGLAFSVVALAAFAAPANAQSTNYLSNQATHCEIFEGLSREVPAECQTKPKMRGLGSLKTRSIRMRPDSVQTAQNTSAQDPKQSDELSISFRAEFEYDSARLTPNARQAIDRVAAVLNHRLMQQKVVQIEGHADASGPDQYNLTLSQKRARVVHEYLVRTHKIDARRLQFVGKGERELFDARNPTSGVNRRVEFKNITG